MSFRVVVAGMGVQGHKRRKAAGPDCVATVDPVAGDVDFRDLKDMPLDSYDAVMACIPDGAKPDLLTHALENGKHVLVEKPLLSLSPGDLEQLQAIAARTGSVCYTAYNHRFEPHFVNLKRLIDSGDLGRIYALRMFYGNGTARLVRESVWRDEGAGVLPDLGSHLLDTLLFWFGRDLLDAEFEVRFANRFENRSFDHVVVHMNGAVSIQLEMTLLMWRNHFTCDVLAEKGTAHIESLCKWGPSTFTHRTRILPSGRPPETAQTLIQPDPTWDAEYAHWKALCQAGGPSNIDNDIWLDARLARLSAQALSA